MLQYWSYLNSTQCLNFYGVNGVEFITSTSFAQNPNR